MNLICLLKGHQYDDYKCVRCGKRREFICFHELMDKDLRELLAYYLTLNPWSGNDELAEAIKQDECYITPEQFAILRKETQSCSTGPGHLKEYDMTITLYRIWLRWLSDTYMEY